MSGATGKRLNFFERYLTLWVGACMLVGVMLGKLVPGATNALRQLEFGKGSQINVPIALLIWLMIYPMMLKIDFKSLLGVRRQSRRGRPARCEPPSVFLPNRPITSPSSRPSESVPRRGYRPA